MQGRVKFEDFSRTFKAMYQQIQGLNTEEKGLEISKIDMDMQNQFNKISVLNVKQFQRMSIN